GDREANAAVAREGRERGVWVNTADDPAHCDFILPGVIRRGELVVAVATGGSSPALSRAIREELEAYFTGDYVPLTEVVAKVRQELRRHALTPDGETWRRALDGHFRDLIADGRSEEAKAYLLERLGGGR
ncbi:MAG: bifunctional precorrin-2 dehydrogenase/sirohydrochlorin ferrochelatase, partial [Candidatus Rokubacteria bacterium]|nr:bifunctional precorrin-2 dehydrogenase/sirohydrochlorin ferrochelatase [Candidatus Rokubacteria bacterium]